MLQEFRMPDPGEGLTEAEVLTWRVAVGDRVRVNDVLLEVETAKAAVELPSPFAGVVAELLVPVGAVVPVGTPIVRIEEDAPAVPVAAGSGDESPSSAGATAQSQTTAHPTGAGQPVATPEDVEAAQAGEQTADAFGTGAPPTGAGAAGAAEAAAGGDGAPTGAPAAGAGVAPSDAPARQAVLVGYGVRPEGAPRRRPRVTPHGVEHPEPGPPGAGAKPVRHGGLEQARAVEGRLGGDQVLAKPPVRRLARDLGVDLARVVPTGPHGSVTHEDVTHAAASGSSSRVVPLSHVARMMAEATTRSAFTAPHVTEWVEVDVTAMSAFLRAARARYPELSMTPLTVAALALAHAAAVHPTINASVDGDSLVLHPAVNLGVAVDTPRGLVVPVIRDAGTLGLVEMAQALGQVIGVARAGRTRPEELRGSTVTITNVGSLGVDGGTPILNTDEVAILAFGRVLPRPWVVDGQVVVRDVVTLALSFDHRVVDGALGARVLGTIADYLADPATALALR